MTQRADWIKEYCSTVGNGNLILTGADAGFGRYLQGMSAGLVEYTVTDGVNRETGVGSFDGANTIIRSTVYATLENGIYNNTNPTPLVLTGDSAVSCSMPAKAATDIEAHPALTDNPHQVTQTQVGLGSVDNTSDADKPVSTATAVELALRMLRGTTVYTDMQEVEDEIDAIGANSSLREAAATGLYSGGEASQNGATTVTVDAGSGEIVDSHTAPGVPVMQSISWPSTDINLLTDSGMPIATGLGYTEVGVGSDVTTPTLGVLKAFPGGMSASDRRDYIKLGAVAYIDQVIDVVNPVPVVANQTGNTIIDFVDFVDLSIRTTGLLLRPTSNANLTMWRDAGTLFAIGSNYYTSLSNQNLKTVDAVGNTTTALNFKRFTYNSGDPVLDILKTVLDTNFEEDGLGTVSSISVGKYVINYMFESIGERFFCQYGQTEYSSYSSAVTALASDRAVHLFDEVTSHMTLTAQIIMGNSSTDFDGIDAGIFPIGTSTSSGSGGGSAAQAVNVTYSDTHSIGTNVQVALDSLATVKMSTDERAAMTAAATPSGSNAFVVMTDITGKATIVYVDAENAAQDAIIAGKEDTSAVDVKLALKAPIDAPTFTGVPAAPTAALGTSTTQLATTEFVADALQLEAHTTEALALSASNLDDLWHTAPIGS